MMVRQIVTLVAMAMMACTSPADPIPPDARADSGDVEALDVDDATIDAKSGEDVAVEADVESDVESDVEPIDVAPDEVCTLRAICGGECVDPDRSIRHCGACGIACPTGGPGTEPICSLGFCGTRCVEGTGDCDSLPENGCEVDTRASTSNCGGCGVTCEGGNATWSCAAGRCVPTCADGFGDCDMDPSNGCETALAGSTEHCGRCGNRCIAGALCVDGTCGCPTGQRECVVGAESRCEDTTANPMRCGACDRACLSGQICVTGECRCPEGEILCGDRCVSGSSPETCGSCTNRCGAEQACAAGTCTCAGGRAACGELCVSTATDPLHCGRCGNRCPGELACIAGACGCDGGRSACGERCFDLSSDTSNCGRCANVCGAGNLCVAGACQRDCGAQSRCVVGGREYCATLDNDVTNCGACGRRCGASETCTAGACRCLAGFTACGASGCVDTLTDRNHCGACGRAVGPAQSCSGGRAVCPAGLSVCGTECVNLGADNANCGACGARCDAPRSCSGGACSCAGGRTFCSGACVDTASSLSHCGGCGRGCDLANAQETCAGGVCTLTSCNPNWGNCDGSSANGCETNLLTDAAHCGRCGTPTAPCRAGMLCSGGACVCPPGTTDCGDTCRSSCIRCFTPPALSIHPLRLIEGDSEFNGHGPDVTVTVNFYRSTTYIRATAQVYMRETVSDWTTGTSAPAFGGLPDAFRYTVSNSSFRTPSGVLLSSGSVGAVIRYRDTNHGCDDASAAGVSGTGASYIRSVTCVGDTDGSDICDNGSRYSCSAASQSCAGGGSGPCACSGCTIRFNQICVWER